MRFQLLLAGVMVLASCKGDNSAPDASRVETHGGPDDHSITGQVVTMTINPDSTFVGVAGATITVLQTSSDPGDSNGVHPDSMVPLMIRGRALFGDSSWIDTIPGDTTSHPPIDTIPVDTITPPPHACGDGQQVATTVSDADGHFTIAGLSAGTYDVIVTPTDAHWGGATCFVDLRTRQTTDIQVFVPTKPDWAMHGHD